MPKELSGIHDYIKHDIPKVIGTRIPISQKVPTLVGLFLKKGSDHTRVAYEADLKDFSKFLGREIRFKGEITKEDSLLYFLSQTNGSANQIAIKYQKHLESKNLADF